MAEAEIPVTSDSTQSPGSHHPQTFQEFQPTPQTTLTRRIYNGSCHCGFIKYTCALTFPPALDIPARPPFGTRIRKCNCSTCHKLSFFHVRPQHAPRDFALLAPEGGPEACSVYRCSDGDIRWCFCAVCSVMVFAYFVDGPEAGDFVDQEGKRVWKLREELKEGVRWIEGKNAYLSVNAVTLEPDQEGLDLREWHEKGWICYLDTKDRVDPNHFGRPSQGGMY